MPADVTVTIPLDLTWRAVALFLAGADAIALGFACADGIGNGPHYTTRQNVWGCLTIALFLAGASLLVLAAFEVYG